MVQDHSLHFHLLTRMRRRIRARQEKIDRESPFLSRSEKWKTKKRLKLQKMRIKHKLDNVCAKILNQF
ncbi:hypothetical protein ACS0TY_004214 [Phlomoides rotata]